MKFSESWLREWANPQITTEELMAQITMAGLEVDGVESAAAEFSGVVVGEIVAIEQHPDADKLRVCQVAGNGDDTVQVVCGAPNARKGLKTAFATVGAKLPGDFKIKKAKLRGVESFGMLCSEDELGVSEVADGIWELPSDAPVGTDVREYLDLNDQLIEVDLTPNRGDCLSVRGVAREVGALNQVDVSEVTIEPVAPQIDDTVSVELIADDGCPNYVGRVIRNVDTSQPTPQWMQEKLRRSGLRSIDPVVDITNYVLLELGQPMHAFDCNKINGGIQVRMADEGEPLKLLDGSEVKLRADTLVIADHSKAVAMAGIMGGDDTAVAEGSTDIFLECAYFNPLTIAGKARSYGMHTDASHRYERGVDPLLQELAVERATQLLLDIAGGQPGPLERTCSAEKMPKPATVTLRKARLQQQLGLTLDDQAVEEMLTRLGLVLESSDNNGWTFTAPSWRFDIAIEADLIEEIARLYGYNRLPTTTLEAPLPILPKQEAQVGTAALRQQLISRGYREAITYSFVDPEQQKLVEPDAATIELANPISADMGVMRTGLWVGLLNTLKHNLNRQQNRVRLFETGLRFVPEKDNDLDGLQQQSVIAGLISGPRLEEGWLHEKNSVDFYDLKGDVESLLNLCGEGGQFQFAKGEHSALHPGQCAQIIRNDRAIGLLGKLHPSVQKSLGLSQDAFLFEIALDGVRDARLPSFQELSKFPEVRRDIALLVDRDVAVGELALAVRQAAGSTLIDLKIFDVYHGKGIDNNRKSIALGLIFRDLSRTLNEQEVAQSVDNVVGALEQKYSATLRG
ncbi:phenylalanine--tRNA ligase subunit beta [Porticoccus sp. W117]|uniref:phenylalanine--tRNA ligase subunit beta n=1 Tax=Porticoccus sp. W117 TaxID=3054777 RepID=UPI00259342DB|nr:phenylalanine--tRNA ligase subunit beta [Porticoccus sp. W117]MDM3872363.1 phenylalanine--tRNA ligase subunit beta [Porticoccus sp. W117]